LVFYFPDVEAKMGKKKTKKKKVMFYARKGKIERTDYDDGSRTVTMHPELEDVFKETEKAIY